MSVGPWSWMIAELRRAVGLGAFLALAAFILGPLLTLLVWAFAGFGGFRRLFQLALILASRSFTHAALFSVPLCALKRDYA